MEYADEYDGEGEEEDQGKCIVDPREAQNECCRLMNNLVQGLHLTNCPPEFTNSQDIQISNLVEAHCRLLGLNFGDYTPARLPWKDIENIILSLRQKYGSSINFNHLDTMLIAQREPTHLLCFLQILNTIYEYYKAKGHTFAGPGVTQDVTMLTSSSAATTPTTSPGSQGFLASIPESSGTEFEIDIVIKPNETGSPVNSETPGSSYQTEYQAQYQTPKNQLKIPPKSKPLARRYGSKTSAFAQAHQSRIQKFKTQEQQKQVQEYQQYAYHSPSSSAEGESPSPLRPSRPPPRVQIRNLDDTDTTMSESSPDININIEFEETATTGPGGASGLVSDHSRRPSPSPNTKGKAKDTDTLTQLNIIHSEIQKNLCDQLLALEKQIHSLKSKSNQNQSKNIKSCCEEKARVGGGKGTGSNNIIIKSKSNAASSRASACISGRTSSRSTNIKPQQSQSGCRSYSAKSKAKIRYDYFGKPYKEKFPYYPGGIIKPRCHSPSKSNKKNNTCGDKDDKFCQSLYKILGLDPKQPNQNPTRQSNVLVDDNGREIQRQQQLALEHESQFQNFEPVIESFVYDDE